MRKFFYYVVLMLVVDGVIYYLYPAGSARLASDVGKDAQAIGSGIASMRENGQLDWDRVRPLLTKLAQDVKADVLSLNAPAASTTAQADAGPDAPPAWKAPDVFPAHDDWTWTTVSGEVYSHVRVVGMAAHSVTIIYRGGGTSIPLSDLSPDLQKALGYAPDLAENAPAPPSLPSAPDAPAVNAVDQQYQATVAQARARGEKVLLLFTGSTWCPTCMALERDVLPTSRFRSFVASGYVMMKIEMAHENLDTDPNQILAAKYGVQGLPTLIATKPDGAEIGRSMGCATDFTAPGSLDGFLDTLTGNLTGNVTVKKATNSEYQGMRSVPGGL